MNRTFNKAPLVILLITAFLHTYVMPGHAESKNDKGKVRVAFLGIKFEETQPDVEKKLYSRMEKLLRQQPAFIITKPEDARISLGGEQVDHLLSQPDSAAYQEAADKLQVDHIFAGHIADHSRNESRVLLVGQFFRYDKKSNLLHKFDILKYYDAIGVEFVKFDKEYVRTIIPESKTKKVLWPWLIVAGLGVASLIALSFVGTKSGSEGGIEPGEPTDH
ncbi:MAG: hypothetical protein ACE5I1_20695 [bacterium]